MASRKGKFNILKYFEDNGSTYVLCKSCNRSLKKDRTFNLKKHIIGVHKIKIEYQDEESTCSENITQPRKEIIKVKINKKQLIRSYIGLVTEESVPFNVLNSKNMRNIIDPICHGLTLKSGKGFKLNGSKCKSMLKHVVENIRSEMQPEMQGRLLSLKIDSATRLSRNIFGISAQFINENEIVSRILGVSEIKDASGSTSKNLAKEIIATLDKYNIRLNQIISITSDNYNNMIKTTKILSQSSMFDDDFEGLEEVEKNIEYTEKIDNFEASEELHVGNIQICRCAAHTAQLCALDVSKKADIKIYLLQCRNMTKYIRRPSHGYREAFDIRKLKMPQLDCPTRWGSTYEMIERLHKAKDILSEIEAIENKTDDENFNASSMLWEFIDGYTCIMNPLQKTIVKFQEEQLHYGNFYALWLTCKLATNQILLTRSDSENSISFEIGKTLIESIDTRTEKLISNVGFDACLYLDPRFQQILTSTRKKNAVHFLKALWEKIKANNPKTNSSTTSINYMSPEEGLENNEFDLLDSYLGCTISPSDECTDVYTKIETLKLPYMKASVNVLNFWRERKSTDPELYALSKVCFAIPPTQVTIERAFSSLKLILADNRNRLSHDTLENILLVKLNSSHLDNAIDNFPSFEDEENHNLN